MSATTGNIPTQFERWTRRQFPVAAGVKCNQGAIACIDIGAGASQGMVKPGASGNANLVFIGRFAQAVDNTAGAAGAVVVDVDLKLEVVIAWFVNDTGTPVLAADVMQDAYILDDQTVTLASAGNSKAGLVWGVDTLKGVAIEYRKVAA